MISLKTIDSAQQFKNLHTPKKNLLGFLLSSHTNLFITVEFFKFEFKNQIGLQNQRKNRSPKLPLSCCPALPGCCCGDVLERASLQSALPQLPRGAKGQRKRRAAADRDGKPRAGHPERVRHGEFKGIGLFLDI